MSCHQGEGRPARLTIALTRDGQSYVVEDDDTLVCSACGDELSSGLIGARAAASLFTRIAPWPQTRR